MAWKGFVIESKKYMNHPDCWKEWNHARYTKGGWTQKSKRRAALKFWLGFPRAWVRFYTMAMRDFIAQYARAK